MRNVISYDAVSSVMHTIICCKIADSVCHVSLLGVNVFVLFWYNSEYSKS